MQGSQSKHQHNLRELQAKFIQNRVTTIEKNVAELCRVLTVYTFHSARIRDSSDSVSQVLLNFGETETVSKSLSNGLKKISLILSQLGDLRDMEVKCLEDEVLNKLAEYEDKCRHAKTEVNVISGAFQKESNRRKECEKIRHRNPRSVQLNTQAENDYSKAQAEVLRKLKIVEEKMKYFEEQKVKDLKSALQCMILANIRQCAKSIELLTQGYNAIEEISEVEDVQSFLDVLSAPENLQRLQTVKKTTSSNSSLNTIASLFSAQSKPQTPEQDEPYVTVMTPVQGFDDDQDDDDDDYDESHDSTRVQKTSANKSPSSFVQKIKSLAI